MLVVNQYASTDMDEEKDEYQGESPSKHEDPADPVHPKRRAEPVLPESRKRRYRDGIPSAPAQTIRDVVKKVRRDRYRYLPLAEGEDIRVLIVEPGQDRDALRCKLVPSALPSTPTAVLGRKVIKYEALSYYWGTEEATLPITVISYDNSAPNARLSMANIVQKKFWIRPNLHAALLQLRDRHNEVRIWVDALCIDQENSQEKAAQVARMHEIYSEADNICIWLGVDETDVRQKELGEVDPRKQVVNPTSPSQTFGFIREMLNLSLLDSLVSNPDYASRWLAFVDLMRSRWFSRRWVIQELALAKAATVHYGREVMLWSDFADAVALFVTKHDQINSLLKKHNNTGDTDPIGDMRALGANALVDATSNLFRKSEDGQILERLLSLETLVSTLVAFESSDPKDTVYAVLSIASDTPYSNARTAAETVTSAVSTPGAPSTLGDPRISPNYQKSLPEICADFVDYCIDKSGSLDIICRHWAPVNKEMPTWISFITNSAFGGPQFALHGRRNGDSLVGTPSRQNHKNYNASAGLKPSYRVERIYDNEPANGIQNENGQNYFSSGGHTGGNTTPRQGSRDYSNKYTGVLYAKGICLDTIEKLSPRAPQGMILRECLQMGGWTYDEDIVSAVPDSLWRTLVADRGPNGANAPSWYRRACLGCFAYVTQNGDLSTGTLMENQYTPSNMVTFLKRVQEVVWDRKFLLSKGSGREGDKPLFGLAPTTAQEGDLICILYGCSVPVILRKMGSDSDPFYHLIGEAYVHGMMDGEAFTKRMPEYPYENSDEFKIK